MTPSEIEKKRAKEKQTLELMIGIYCHGMHKQKKKQLCPECQALRDYAVMRTEKCPFMETKTFCSACKVHCYTAQRQEQIRAVMRYAGPRMMLYHPIAAIRHCIVTMRNVRASRRAQK